FNIDLGMGAYIAIIVTSTLGAVGQAGVPGPSFLVVAVLLAAGIPIEGLPLLFALDRIFDMIRTALNITGDAACAVIIDAIAEEETQEEMKQQEA
ncbi:cation:dicarboxylate symporter family transporter, partial [Vibrio harveyi]|uniref:cation:dicarboxylate symporter family transporter n=1 Tax=Vibrio harveyi TaxID=669 RepID=UPI001ED932C4